MIGTPGYGKDIVDAINDFDVKKKYAWLGLRKQKIVQKEWKLMLWLGSRNEAGQ